MEIHPLNQSQVPRPLQRVVEYRAMNVRRWDRIVDAWSAGDQQGLDDAWRTSSSTWDPRFTIAASGPAQGLRPLRDPDEADPADEDQDEG